MANKIRISEAQYQRLLQRLDETPFDKMVTDSMEVGDILTITRNKGTNRFKIVDKNDDGVFMDNIDKGSTGNQYFFVNSHSLNGSVLEMKMIDKNSDQNILQDVSQWESYTLPDVKNIVVSRDRKPVDRVDKIDGEESQQPQPDNSNNNDNDDDDKFILSEEFIIDVLRTTKEKKRIDLSLKNGDELHFCCINRRGSNVIIFSFELEMSYKNSIPALNDYNEFILALIPDEELYVEKNKFVVSPNEDGTFNIVLKCLNNGNVEREIEITDITHYDVTSSCVGTTDDEEQQPDDEEEPLRPLSMDDEEDYGVTDEVIESDDEAENMYNNIVNDPEMKKAFFKQPTFWQHFVNYLRSDKKDKKKYRGTGIVAALNTVNKYVNKKLMSKIGPGFPSRGHASFNPVKDEVIPYTIGEENHELAMPIVIGGYYKAKIRQLVTNVEAKVLSMPSGQKDENNNKELFLFIMVHDATSDSDIKVCDLKMGYYRDNPDNTSIGGGLTNVKIQFYESEGYNPEVYK